MTARAASNNRSASPSDRALPLSVTRKSVPDSQDRGPPYRPAQYSSQGIDNGLSGAPQADEWGSQPTRHREYSSGDEIVRHDSSRLPAFALTRSDRNDWQTLPPLGSDRRDLPPALPSWASTGRMPPPRLAQSNDNLRPLRSLPSEWHPSQARTLPQPETPQRSHGALGRGNSGAGDPPLRPLVPGMSADYPPRRQTRSRSNSLRRASSTDGYYGEPYSATAYREAPPSVSTPVISTPDDDGGRFSGYWDSGSPVKQEWGARSAPNQGSWGKLPTRGQSEAPSSHGSPYSLPPLSSITSSLGSSPNHPGLASYPSAQAVQPSPVRRFSSAVTVTQKRTWSELATSEKRDSIQQVLARYMRARVRQHRQPAGLRQTSPSDDDMPEDDFFVTLSCSHSGVAQKSYGHEKRFLCPPPIVRIRGPGFTRPAPTPDGIRHLRMSILTGGGESGMSPSAGEQIVSEDISLDRSLHAKFGHLHVGSSTSNAKTFKLQLDMVKTVSMQTSPAPGYERRFKSPRLSDSSDSYFGSPRGVPASSSGPVLNVPGSQRQQTSMVVRQQNWLTCESDTISVISKPSKKTTKAKTSSSQITPNLAICLFNRVNSQNVRTKYMAVDDGQLSARNDSWTSFFMRPLDPAGHSDQRAGDAVTYGSVIVLEVPGQGAVSDPLVVCKVEKGRIVVPAALAQESALPPNSMQPPLMQQDSSDGPISQMQKVAFMRYEPPSRRSPPGRSDQRTNRSFLCSAPPDPWWRPMGAQHDLLAESQHPPTFVPAPMRPVSSLAQGSDRVSAFDPHPRSSSNIAESQQGWTHRSSRSSSPHPHGRSATGNEGAEPSVLRSAPGSRHGMGVPEPLAPTPLTFLPAGRDETRAPGSLNKDQDVADDAFCWSVVGAAHFEYSFMRVGHTVEAEEMPPPTESPVGCLPRLLSPPHYSVETHTLRIRGENLIDPAAAIYRRPGPVGPTYDAWLGSFGPLVTEVVPPAAARGMPSSPPLLSVRLPVMMDLVQYASALEVDVNGAHAGGHAGSSPSSRLVKLPILLVREADGLVCSTAYFIEVVRVDSHHSAYPSGSYGAPHQRLRSGEWSLRITD